MPRPKMWGSNMFIFTRPVGSLWAQSNIRRGFHGSASERSDKILSDSSQISTWQFYNPTTSTPVKQPSILAVGPRKTITVRNFTRVEIIRLHYSPNEYKFARSITWKTDDLKTTERWILSNYSSGAIS